MLNAIKMDLLRMWKSRSLYVVWIIMSALLILTTWLSTWELKKYENENYPSGYEQELTEPETVNVGMSVSLPTAPGQKITLLDMCYANMQAKFIALFMVIFAVLFSTADFNSGYIKNIAGQIIRRSHLIVSKAVSLFVYTICTLLLAAIIQGLSNLVFLGYLKIGDTGALIKYLAVSVLLHFALLLICMTFSIALRNNVVSIVLAICMCMNLMIIIYSFVDKALGKIGIENFELVKYTVTGKMAMLPMSPTNAACGSAAAVALAFTAVMFICSCFVFSKRDI